jgi:hypothetical protein
MMCQRRASSRGAALVVFQTYQVRASFFLAPIVVEFGFNLPAVVPRDFVQALVAKHERLVVTLAY